MGTTLHTLKAPAGATKRAKRVGRGIGSGRGKTSTRGVKGQKARTGHHGARFGFEGGQMPLQRRLPKRGFKNVFRTEYFGVNVASLEERMDSGAVDLDGLKAAGLVPRKAKLVKILGTGELKKKFDIRIAGVSAKAREKIEAAGGTVELVGAPFKNGDSDKTTEARA